MDEIVKEVKQAMYYILKLAKEQGCRWDFTSGEYFEYW